jgi:MerR family transcriptional regulator, light-induced transcriptional regulator
VVEPTTARGLNIAALSQRTGVAADTLRKWEQRYGILRPERTAGGQRRYSERDVARVEWLLARLTEGYRIGEAALLLGRSETPAGRTSAEQVATLLEAAERGDAGEVGLGLDQAFALQPLETVLTQVVDPLLREVGRRWQRGELSVAQEHLVSAAARARLAHLLDDAGGGVRGGIVLACAPDERHELGLMSVGIALRNDGWQITYVGADTPLADAIELAERVSARVLGLSVTGEKAALSLTRALAKAKRPAGLELLLGGAGASRSLARKLHARYLEGDLIDIVHGSRELAAPSAS